MRTALLVAVLCSTAHAQFNIVDQQRSATARVSHLVDIPGQERHYVTDERTRDDEATASIVVNPNALARITSWVTASADSRILDAAGGIRGIEAFGGQEITGWAQSEYLVTFDVARPTRANLSVVIVDPPKIYAPGGQTHVGDASFTLTGPSGIVAECEADGEIRYDLNWWDQLPPHTADEVLLLEAGRYTLHLLASHTTPPPLQSAEFHIRDASFDFHLEAMPIPEPATEMLVVAVLMLTLFPRRGFPIDRRYWPCCWTTSLGSR